MGLKWGTAGFAEVIVGTVGMTEGALLPKRTSAGHAEPFTSDAFVTIATF